MGFKENKTFKMMQNDVVVNIFFQLFSFRRKRYLTIFCKVYIVCEYSDGKNKDVMHL